MYSKDKSFLKDMDKKIIDIIRLKLDRPVVFVGMMGCGKSELSQEFARIVGLCAYDVDRLIEAEQGRSISEIFEKDGEMYFRALEAKKIIELLASGTGIIATGGGALMNPDVLGAIQVSAISIWLKTDEDILVKRLKGDKTRPMLAGGDLEKRVKELLVLRTPLYAQADIQISNNGDLVEALDQIGRALADYL